MSADNFVGVRGNKDGTYDIFEYGCMSILQEDCMYLSETEPTKTVSSRAEALVMAHDMVKDMSVCEYGVVELDSVPDTYCGRCYVCVHMRFIVHDDVDKCVRCSEPISDGEWMTITQEGKMHSSCERR